MNQSTRKHYFRPLGTLDAPFTSDLSKSGVYPSLPVFQTYRRTVIAVEFFYKDVQLLS